MTNQHESFPDLMQDESFEVVMRGYSRGQVREYVTRTRNQIRDLEERLARALEQAEQARVELAEARRRMVETPQSYEDLSPRLAQILKLGEEEAAAKRQEAEADAKRLREEATAEAERLVTSAREQADHILASAQAEAERRVGEASTAAENMVAQANAEAEETVRNAQAEAERTITAARAEAEQTVNHARAEAQATLEAARAEAESTLNSARREAEATLTAAQQRAAALDQHTGQRVAYLTDTHAEVMRRLNEIGSVLGELLQQEQAAGPLVDEAAVLPPAHEALQTVEAADAPEAQAAAPAEEPGFYAHPAQENDTAEFDGPEPQDAVEAPSGDTPQPQLMSAVDDVHVMVEDPDRTRRVDREQLLNGQVDQERTAPRHAESR